MTIFQNDYPNDARKEKYVLYTQSLIILDNILIQILTYAALQLQ